MIIKYEDLNKIKNNGDKIVLCTGCFDLFHAGHLYFFESAKKYGNKLVVAVLNDNKIKEKKGNKRPIINEKDRLKLLDSLRIVDYVILMNDNNYGCDMSNDEIFFWNSYGRLFEELQPDILCCSKFHNISVNMQDMFDKYKIDVVRIDLKSNLSTSKIIEKINNI